MFGLDEFEFRLVGLGVGWGGGLFFSFIFYLVWLMLGCILKIGSINCLEVPSKFLWGVVVGGG
jgi:hypothetical protein